MTNDKLDALLVGQAISKVRQEKGVTQAHLGVLAGIGRTHLSAIERGERKPTLETLWRIALALDIRPSELVCRIEKMAEM